MATIKFDGDAGNLDDLNAYADQLFNAPHPVVQHVLSVMHNGGDPASAAQADGVDPATLGLDIWTDLSDDGKKQYQVSAVEAYWRYFNRPFKPDPHPFKLRELVIGLVFLAIMLSAIMCLSEQGVF